MWLVGGKLKTKEQRESFLNKAAQLFALLSLSYLIITIAILFPVLFFILLGTGGVFAVVIGVVTLLDKWINRGE